MEEQKYKIFALLLSCAPKTMSMKRIVLVLLVCFAASFTMQAQSTKVLIKTNKGNIIVMLYDDTPMHKDNFIELVNNKFYDGILFHRIIENFMIQVGNPNSRDKSEKSVYKGETPNYKIPAEIRPNHYHKKGALAAARQGDQFNPEKQSSGTQFYIVQGRKQSEKQLNQREIQTGIKYTAEQRKQYLKDGGVPQLDFEYTVFGEVVNGLDIVDVIAGVKCGARDKPIEDVKIISALIIK